MFGLSDSIMCWSDDVLGSGSVLHLVLLGLEALLAICDRVAYLDAVLHKLDADKGLFFLSLILLDLILYGIVQPSDLHGNLSHPARVLIFRYGPN